MNENRDGIQRRSFRESQISSGIIPHPLTFEILIRKAARKILAEREEGSRHG